MREVINEKVSVVTIYNREKRLVTPYKLRWQGREYRIVKVGYHHRVWEGRTRLHIFSVSTPAMAFRLKHNTETLDWTLEEVSDGIAD